MSNPTKEALQREYQRGYQNAINRGRHWPDHRPPVPPDPIIARLMTALQELRDECDSMCATFSPDDEIVLAIGPKIDAADEAMIAVTAWLKEPRP